MTESASGEDLRIVIVNPDEFTRALLRRHRDRL